MAFVPVQGRSLDIWILAFIRSIYSPTQYVWKKSKEVSKDMALSTGPIVGTQAVSNARIELSTGATSSSPQPTSVVSEPITSNSEPLTPLVSITPAIVTPNTPLPETPFTVSDNTPASPAIPITTISTQIPITNNQELVTPQAAQLPIPFTPTTPNTLVGLTLTPEGNILEAVLVEIQKNGLTSRATKSNKLGQFMFARPLENGLYQILAEKEGFTFSPYSLDLSGTIIRPLKIQAI
ncbi:MAG: hypothetical protein UW41_C0011G0002 [Candidatus Collierbacteria bacterium GW2011_GWC2_44_18]|uniref:Uncharacterized protein n=2 Tax=Microgenomates group TaxID=1794810 RepID=A0A0G1HQD5_9BACT|nr:MAG: hypothetical protein UW41_C0011G0002 [Candidatus Collierbacteria bacterium GW2011_GWC2_44_18]